MKPSFYSLRYKSKINLKQWRWLIAFLNNIIAKALRFTYIEEVFRCSPPSSRLSWNSNLTNHSMINLPLQISASSFDPWSLTWNQTLPTRQSISSPTVREIPLISKQFTSSPHNVSPWKYHDIDTWINELLSSGCLLYIIYEDIRKHCNQKNRNLHNSTERSRINNESTRHLRPMEESV